MPKGKKKKENFSKKNPIPQTEAKRVKYKFFSKKTGFPLMNQSSSVLWNGTRKPFSDEFVWLLVLGLWMAGIFIASSVPGTGENYWDFRTFLERKGAHVFEYFVLAYLFWKVTAFQKISFSRKMIVSVFAALLYAFSDEIHQLFVFGREGQLLDVGIDFAGILLFILLIEVKTGIFPKEKTRR